MIAKRYDDELMYSVQRCDDSSNKYKYCTKDGKLAFKKPDKDFLGVTKQNYKNVYVINGEIYIGENVVGGDAEWLPLKSSMVLM